jgi:ATP-dependent DNA ligase
MIRAELLRDANDAIIKRLTFDSDYVFQEKFNGDRRLIEKRPDGTVLDFNRDGLPGKGLPEHIKTALRKHPMYQFVLDVELVGSAGSEVIFVFDLLHFGDEVLVLRPYSYREAMYHGQFTGFNHITPVKSARTPEEKVALIQRLIDERAEGFVAKDLKAHYRPADNNQRYNWRYKFWKTLDAVVIGNSTKRRDNGNLSDSVRLGCYDEKGMLHDICGSTKKSAFILRPGDVVELKYLYGTGTLDVVQPTILRLRDDKAPHLCTLDQIVVNKNWKSGRKQ